MGVFLFELLPLAVKFVRHPLDKEHAEDIFLEFGGIHLASQDIRGFEQEVFKLFKGDFFLINLYFPAFLVGMIFR